MNTPLHIELWQLLTLTALIVAGFWAVGMLFVTQFEKRLDEKFIASEKRLDEKFSAAESVRREAAQGWDKRYALTEAAVKIWGERLIMLEAEFRHVPTQREFAALNDAVTRLRGETEAQTSLLQRLDNQMRLINEWMLENK